VWEELFLRIPLSNAHRFVTNTLTTYQGNKDQFYTFEFRSPKVDIEKGEHHKS